METIALLLPTRQRAKMLTELYESAMRTADFPEKVIVVVYVDTDDSSYDYIRLPRLRIIRGPRQTISKCWNVCWEAARKKATIFHHCGDDNIFRSDGWDTVVRNLFASIPDKIVFVYGRDGNGESEQNKFGTHGFIHKNWTDAVGYFVPPYYESDYNDTHLNDMAKAIDRHVYVDLFIEHMHFSLGKMEIDQNTRDRLERHTRQKPEEVYNSLEKRIERENDIEKLRVFIENFKA